MSHAVNRDGPARWPAKSSIFPEEPQGRGKEVGVRGRNLGPLVPPPLPRHLTKTTHRFRYRPQIIALDQVGERINLGERGRKRERQKVDSLDTPGRDVSRPVGVTGSQESDTSGTRIEWFAKQTLSRFSLLRVPSYTPKESRSRKSQIFVFGLFMRQALRVARPSATWALSPSPRPGRRGLVPCSPFADAGRAWCTIARQ